MPRDHQPERPMNRGLRRRLQKLHREQQWRLSMAPTKREVANAIAAAEKRRSLRQRMRRVLKRLTSFLNQRVKL